MTTEDPSPGPVSEAESTAKPNPLVASDHGLTEEQQEAMKLGRHLAVTAAAGTGKTTALAARYLHILQQTDSTPTEIATITFTRKATTEMRDRIRENVSEQLQSIEDGDSFDRWRGIADELTEGYIHTIDAFCARLLREYAVEAGVDPEFEMLDEVDAPVVQREAISNWLDRNGDSSDLNLVARLWNRDTLIEIIRGLFRERPDSSEWAQARVDQTDAEYESDLFDVFAELEPAEAREFLSSDEMQAALSTFRDLDLEALGVPESDYAWENIHHYLRPAGQSDGARKPKQASDEAVLKTVRRLCDGVTTSDGNLYSSVRGRGSHYIAGKKGNWPDESQETYRDALETLIDALRPCEEAVRTIPSLVDQNAAPYVRALARVYLQCLETYEERKRERTAFDFNDLLTHVLELLRSDPSIRSTLQDRFEHIMVDEFQDTDPRQWSLVSLLSGLADPERDVDDEATLFVVGDKKQSIYRFRGADVATFSAARADLVEANLQRPHISQTQGGTNPPTELALTGSFRTVTEPVEILNPLFEHVFSPVDEQFTSYEAEPQSITSKRKEGTDLTGSVEYLVVPGDAEAASVLYPEEHPLLTRAYLDSGDREAHALAARISSHLETKTEIYDTDEKEYRAIEPRDIAILLRTRKNLDAYERAFNEYGIDVNIVSGDGYWQTPEVRLLSNLVEVLFDPTQDIPLYGLLRSPMFGLTDSKLAAHAEDGGLWEAMSETTEDPIVEAREQIVEWRSLYGVRSNGFDRSSISKGEMSDESPLLSVNMLLSRICEQTGLIASVAAGERGQQASANIRKFIEQVRQWNDQGVRTLTALRDRITTQQSEAAKEREASLPTETGGVRVLTVHAAKGLEFPMVAVPGLGREFNLDGSLDERKQTYLGEFPPHESTSDHYLGISAPDSTDTYTTAHTRVREGLRNADIDELRAEEKRTLYVACTRVRDHLLLSGTHEVTEQEVDENTEETSENPAYTFAEPAKPASAKTWRDWVQPTLLSEEDELVSQLRRNERVDTLSLKSGGYSVTRPPVPIKQTPGGGNTENPVERSIKLSTEVEERPPERYTASQITQGLDEHNISPDTNVFVDGRDQAVTPEEIITQPNNEDPIPGDTLGTIVHRICEFAPFDSQSDIESTLDRILTGIDFAPSASQRKRIQAYVSRTVDYHATQIDRFDQRSIRHEVPIRLMVDETTIVGEIDLLVVSEEAYHIIDYKTNRVDDIDQDIERLCSHYRAQLEVYAAALQRADPKRRVTASLYFVSADIERRIEYTSENEPIDAVRRYLAHLKA
jgi:ATP-dependent helicase/nuclease subunit A